jgi:hypothetical protein
MRRVGCRQGRADVEQRALDALEQGLELGLLGRRRGGTDAGVQLVDLAVGLDA